MTAVASTRMDGSTATDDTTAIPDFDDLDKLEAHDALDELDRPMPRITKQLRAVTDRLVEQAPAVAGRTRGAIGEANVQLEKVPDQGLLIAAGFSLGMGVTAFLTGAPRLIILLAIAPAFLFARQLLQRGDGIMPGSRAR